MPVARLEERLRSLAVYDVEAGTLRKATNTRCIAEHGYRMDIPYPLYHMELRCGPSQRTEFEEPVMNLLQAAQRGRPPEGFAYTREQQPQDLLLQAVSFKHDVDWYTHHRSPLR